MHITAILPVSREHYLKRVIESLVNQTFQPDALIMIYDGSEDEFFTVREYISQLHYERILCVKSVNDGPAPDIPERRRHISNIHNQIRTLLEPTDWIFSIEDDGLLPADALERLVGLVESRAEVGIATGVELGRWGVPYVGAWTVDSLTNTKAVTSLISSAGSNVVEEIDACGLYCALIREQVYRGHQFTSDNGLGPDVNLGLDARRSGFRNYIDWGIPLTHLTSRNGVEIEIPATDPARRVELQHGMNTYWRQVRL